MKKIISWAKYIPLLIVPLLVIIYQQNITKNIYFSDPDYAYILNGLNINILKLPLYSDHPGVPLTMLSAIGLRVIYWFSGSSTDIQTDVLTNPAFYEVRLQLILFSLIIAVTLFSGYWIYKVTKNIYLGIISQAIPLLFSTSIALASANYMPDAMLIIILHLFIILTVQYVVKETGKEDTTKEKWLFPVLCGLALSVKIIILPILILPVILLGMNIKKIVQFSGVTLLSFIVFTLPVMEQYPSMMRWFLSLFTHSGIYGGGSATIINPQTYFKNIKFIVSDDQLMAAMMILTLILLPFLYYLKRKGKIQINDILPKLLIALIITQVISILIVSKTFDGKSYYLIVTYALTTASFVVSLVILIKYLKLSKLIVAAILTCFLTFSIWVNWKNYMNEYAGRYKAQNESIELQQFLNGHNDYNVITNNAYSLNKNQALLFGLAYSRAHEERLMQLYPKAYFYNVIPGKFTNWYREVVPDQVFVNKKALLVDTYLNDIEKADLQNRGYTLKLLFSNRTKAVYELNRAINAQQKLNYKAFIAAKMKAIYLDEKWLNSIKEKAIKNGISLDSMVYLDAKWMIDTYGK